MAGNFIYLFCVRGASDMISTLIPASVKYGSRWVKRKQR